MRHRLFFSFCALLLWVALAVVSTAPARAQETRPMRAPAVSAWTPPRTADGQPSLEGLWNNASITPLERPVELGDKAFFTEQEGAAYESARNKELNRDRRDGPAQTDLGRAYNEAWFDRGTGLSPNRRTSRIVDPPNGRFPPMTPAAQKRFAETRAWFDQHPGDGPEDRTLNDRCLVFSQSGPPLLPGNYNDNYQIIQAKGYVAILAEMGHQTRIIPISERPRLPERVTQWMGDSRGHWEGNTLVVETTNVRFNDRSRFGVQYENGMSDGNLRVTERFTRVDPKTIIYRATVDDPTVYTKPWTIETPMEKTDGPLYEYACHEGNYGLAGILSGIRAEEKAAERK
jgi:hypothetical protein